MGFFRSENIDIFKLSINKDYDWKIMDALGEIGALHFMDLNKDKQAYELPYTSMIKAAEDSERKIAYIEGIFKNFQI